MISELTLTRFGVVDDEYLLPQKFVDSTNSTVSIGIGIEISLDRGLVSLEFQFMRWIISLAN